MVNKPRKSQAEKDIIYNYYITNTLDISFSIDDFLLPTKFQFEFGKSLEDITTEAKDKILYQLQKNFSAIDIDSLFYPNSIQKIAELSIEHDENKRLIKKEDLISEIISIKKAAITRWTKELTTYHKILKKRKEQLSENLHKNIRIRCLILKDNFISDFSNEIVNFIIDFIDTYNYKVKLHKETPVFCIDTSNPSILNEIEKRLHTQKIEIETGFRGTEFFSSTFFRVPLRTSDKVEFRLRLCILNDMSIQAINNEKCNDLYIVSDDKYSKIDKLDLNVEYLEIDKFKELKYLLSISKNID